MSKVPFFFNSIIRFFEKLTRRAILKNELTRESKLVRENSMTVLKVFETLEDELPQNC